MPKVLTLEEQSHMNKREEDGNFDQRPDYGGKCSVGTDAKDRDGHGNSQFKVVARGGESQRGCPAVVGPQLSAEIEADKKHDHEIPGASNGLTLTS